MDRSLRILHLEDEPDFCELVKALLAKDGLAADIVLVGDLEGFIAALDKGGFDIILTDYRLPSCTGIEALREARQRCPGTPFVLVSGTIGEQATIEAMKCGATDYVLSLARPLYQQAQGRHALRRGRQHHPGPRCRRADRQLCGRQAGRFPRGATGRPVAPGAKDGSHRAARRRRGA